MRKLDQAAFEKAILDAWDGVPITSDFSAMQKRAAQATARLAYVMVSELQRLPDNEAGQIINLLAAINASVLHNLAQFLKNDISSTDEDKMEALFAAFSEKLFEYVKGAKQAVAAEVRVPTVDVGDA